MLRITGGKFKNKQLASPAGDAVRPASDRNRQTVFNILSHASWLDGFSVDGANVLDLFCGTGVYGLEALSRGASRATFADGDRSVLDITRKNAATCKVEAVCTFLCGKLPAALPKSGAFDLVFIDPPYHQGLGQPVMDALPQVLADKAIVVVESERSLPLNGGRGLLCLDRRDVGISSLSFWRYDPAIHKAE